MGRREKFPRKTSLFLIFPKKNVHFPPPSRGLRKHGLNLYSHRLGLYSPIFPKISQIFGKIGLGKLRARAPKAAVLQSCRAKLHFQLSISNLAYSEPGSPFPDCREGLTDRLSDSVLLPGIEPREPVGRGTPPYPLSHYRTPAVQSCSSKLLPNAAAQSCSPALLPKVVPQAVLQSCCPKAAKSCSPKLLPKIAPQSCVQSYSPKVLPKAAGSSKLPCKAAPQSCSLKLRFFKPIP